VAVNGMQYTCAALADLWLWCWQGCGERFVHIAVPTLLPGASKVPCSCCHMCCCGMWLCAPTLARLFALQTIDASIHRAYIHLIRGAERYLYLENQVRPLLCCAAGRLTCI
jgi:hypothetical protein